MALGEPQPKQQHQRVLLPEASRTIVGEHAADICAGGTCPPGNGI